MRIDVEKIANLEESMLLLTTQLKSRGYGEKQPPCRLEVTQDENTMRVSLILTGGRSSITLSIESIVLSDISNHEELLEAFSYRLEEGELSEFNIVNELEFIETLKNLFKL